MFERHGVQPHRDGDAAGKYHVRAQRNWLGVVDFDYPLDWSSSQRSFKSMKPTDKQWSGMAYTIQVAPEDCTGCTLCVNVCPGKDKTNPKHKAINMQPAVIRARNLDRQTIKILLEAANLPVTKKNIQDIQKELTETDKMRPKPKVDPRPEEFRNAGWSSGQKMRYDLAFLAFQTDSTRIVTMMMGREGSMRTYPEIGVPDPHHPLSHHGNDPDKVARMAKINQFHVSLFAEYLEKLTLVKEGNAAMEIAKVNDAEALERQRSDRNLEEPGSAHDAVPSSEPSSSTGRSCGSGRRCSRKSTGRESVP